MGTGTDATRIAAVKAAATVPSLVNLTDDALSAVMELASCHHPDLVIAARSLLHLSERPVVEKDREARIPPPRDFLGAESHALSCAWGFFRRFAPPGAERVGG